MSDLEQLRNDFSHALSQSTSLAQLEELRLFYLGKKGVVTSHLRTISSYRPEERKERAQELNLLKQEIQEDLDRKFEILQQSSLAESLERERVDVTLPGRASFLAGEHPLRRTMEEALEILSDMGFAVQLGPHIETDYYNFEALNFPKHHPAREMQDTFYLSKSHLLRTQNTGIQTRIMEKFSPPLRVATPGPVFRNETVTKRSHVFFHQIDVFCVDRGISFVDLLSTLRLFLGKIFRDDELKLRFRPSYFPFVEPGVEVDVGCSICRSLGCSMCKGSGYLEILGAGMIHPEVLNNGGVDPERFSGFAWGMGLDRITCIRHRIDDIRLFSENDFRFLRQYR